MPADPEPPPGPPAVEAMLWAAARRRREEFDAAGPGASAMSGPVRTRLHAELARQFGGASPSGTHAGWRRLARWWPAMAGAVGVAAALAVFVLAGHQRPTAGPVAINATPRPAPVITPQVDAPAPAAVPPPLAPPPQEPDTVTAADTVAQTRAAAPPVPEPPVRTQTFTRSFQPLAVASSSLRAPAAPVAAGPRRRETEAAAAPAAGSGTPPTPMPLLGSFRFEQRGENVRVVDADGSVYVGYVQPAGLDKADKAKQASPAGVKQKDLAGKAESQTEAGDSFRFRATGDSRTLRQAVVFEGEYSPVQTPQTSQKPQAPTKKQAPTADAPAAQIRGLLRVLDGRDDQRGAEVEARSVESPSPR